MRKFATSHCGRVHTISMGAHGERGSAKKAQQNEGENIRRFHRSGGTEWGFARLMIARENEKAEQCHACK